MIDDFSGEVEIFLADFVWVKEFGEDFFSVLYAKNFGEIRSGFLDVFFWSSSSLIGLC